MKIREVGTEELQQCPAAVMVDGNGSPTFLVNREVFPTADAFARKFYLAHELGHYLLGTSSEEAADAFALSALAGTERNSLKKSIETLYHVQAIPYERMLALYTLALQIDKSNNSNNLLTIMKKKIWNNKQQDLFFGRLDGEETVEPTDTPNNTTVVAAANALGDIIGGNNRRRAGLRINNVFFPLESILLTSILIVLVIVCCKK